MSDSYARYGVVMGLVCGEYYWWALEKEYGLRLAGWWPSEKWEEREYGRDEGIVAGLKKAPSGAFFFVGGSAFLLDWDNLALGTAKLINLN